MVHWSQVQKGLQEMVVETNDRAQLGMCWLQEPGAILGEALQMACISVPVWGLLQSQGAQ